MHENPNLDVVLLGASTRAMAFSALRAGLTPWCVDLFADRDLTRHGHVRKIPFADYPAGLFEVLPRLPPGPWIYGGSLENAPALFASTARVLWGNPASVVRKVRDPRLLAQHWQQSEVSAPRVAFHPCEADAASRWLLKPRRSAAGLNIREWIGQPFSPRNFFLQERIEGPVQSAIFLGRPGGEATLIGVSSLLAGTAWLHASEFTYSGSIGPIPISIPEREHWQRLGDSLSRSFGLLGLFGLDAVHHQGVPWPIEVNPRYTASVEIYERGFDIALLDAHRRVFTGDESTPLGLDMPPSLLHGKAILYAKASLTFPDSGPWDDSLACDPPWRAEYADLPNPGERFESGQPILTVFATGGDVDACTHSLQEKVQHLDRWLGQS